MSSEPQSTVRIDLVGISALGRHGVLDSEQANPQPFEVDVSMAVDWPECDDLQSTVDYSVIAACVADIVQHESYLLIESLAKRIAEVLLGFSPVREVTIRVHKPQAPVAVVLRDIMATYSARQE